MTRNEVRIPSSSATTPPTSGPTALARIWVACSLPIAGPTSVCGAPIVTRLAVIGPKPPNSPMQARSTSSCQGLCTSESRTFTITKQISARWTMILTPCRSASEPQKGASSPESSGATAKATPESSAASPRSVTPSSRT